MDLHKLTPTARIAPAPVPGLLYDSLNFAATLVWLQEHSPEFGHETQEEAELALWGKVRRWMELNPDIAAIEGELQGTVLVHWIFTEMRVMNPAPPTMMYHINFFIRPGRPPLKSGQ